MKRRKNPFVGVHTAEDRHGKLRHRLKRKIKGRIIDCYLPGPYGSPAFRSAYEEAVEGARTAGRRVQPGTVAHLIVSYLDSSAYRSLEARTRRDARGRLDWIREAIGTAKYAKLEPRHVAALMEKKGGPAAANRLRKDLGQLYRFAAKRLGYTGQNPAALADPHRTKRGGYHTWTDAEIERYRETYPSGSKARLALELLLATGASRVDAVALTRANIRGGRITFRRAKTTVAVDLPLLPELEHELALLPAPQMVLLARNDGETAYAVESFGILFRRWCNEAGVPGSAHGLRKAGARRLAEAGATEFEVMSFLGHASAKEASRYVAAANRATLADSGMAKLGAEGVQKFPNLIGRLGQRGS